MTGPGKNRDWGYASYYEDDNDETHLIYTSYENNGSVNRYTDNGDGGHGHARWEDRDDYDNGEDPDWSRQESNDKSNPETGEVERNGGCYLTSACIYHYKSKFDDNCIELKVLRWFRDNVVPKKDVEEYYSIAPTIVKEIEKHKNKEQYYNFIYNKVVKDSVLAIKKGDFKFAYKRYKSSVQLLKNQFIGGRSMYTNINEKKVNSEFEK